MRADEGTRLVSRAARAGAGRDRGRVDVELPAGVPNRMAQHAAVAIAVRIAGGAHRGAGGGVRAVAVWFGAAPAAVVHWAGISWRGHLRSHRGARVAGQLPAATRRPDAGGDRRVDGGATPSSAVSCAWAAGATALAGGGAGPC